MKSHTLQRKPPRGARARRVTEAKVEVQGWRTSDEDEIERRRQRGMVETFALKTLEAEHPVFGTFAVASGGDVAYEVEIRSLTERDNSCGCPDHRVNGLGTCKHVEAVLARLKRKLGRRFEILGAEGSERVEIFLRLSSHPPRVAISWPRGTRRLPRVQGLLAPYFSTDGTLLADPVAAIPELRRRLTELPHALRGRVRISRHLATWQSGLERRARQTTARDAFLADVAAGKRSLNLARLPLYPYQQEGALHLAFTERAILGDEMGLGKTVQAIAACELLRQLKRIERVLVVSPASLKAEWEEQIGKFTGLPAKIIYGPRAARLKQYREPSFFYLTNYEQIVADGPDLQALLAPDVVILDEAQRIKNWQTKTAAVVKRLASPYAFVLTGTPLENRIDDIYSIVQFLDPGILGPLFRFNRDFYELDEDGRPTGYKNLGELHRRLKPVLLRRLKAEVEEQLPSRTFNTYFVGMEPEQRKRYEEYNDRVARLLAMSKRRPLTPAEFEKLQRSLACMRMLCDTPYILDRECRLCPKLAELEEILSERLAHGDEKILIFSEWQRMLEMVRDLAKEMGVGFAWHTGSVPQPVRRQEIRRFKDSSECRLFLSTDSGSVGLNLQAASVVINLDLPWNPARLEQRIARAWRKHQTRSVQVMNLVTEESIESRMLQVLAGKQALADGVLDGRGDLDSLTMPSGRAAFMGRLEEILSFRVEPRGRERDANPAPERPRPAEVLRQSLVASLGEGLLLLEQRLDAKGSPALLAVVEKAAASSLGEMRALASAALRTSAAETAETPAVEVMDRATYETILRLAERGLLQLAPGAAELLHRSPSFGDPERSERERRLRAARESLQRGERQSRLAAHLAGGGFAAEALPALREALGLGLEGVAHLAGVDLAAGGPLSRPTASLLGVLAPRAPEAIEVRDRLSAPAAPDAVSDQQAREWVDVAETLLRELEAALARAALGKP